MKKRFIEWNIPIKTISKASTHEKSVRHGHPSTLMLWWARRPLAASRATTLAALIDLPTNSQRKKEIFTLIEEISPWSSLKKSSSSYSSIYQSQKLLKDQWTKNPPKIIDPFSGGGSIPLEALRLGCETYACDLNPIAVLISKATIEWPQRYYDKDLGRLIEEWSKKINEKSYEEIGRFYPTDSNGNIPIGYLWARTIPCINPNCQSEIPLIKHFWLARKKGRLIAYKPIINKNKKKIKFHIQQNDEIDFNPSQGTVSRARAECLICGQVIKTSMIYELAQNDKMKQKMTIVILRHPNKTKKIYRVANKDDMDIYDLACRFLEKKLSNYEEIDPLLPDEDLPALGTLGFGIQNYGITKWRDLFNQRQKLTLITFLMNIRAIYPSLPQIRSIHSQNNQIINENLADIILAYLTIILGRLADKNANLVIYNAYGEKIEHVFGRTALPMAWDYVELNVFSGANGDWLRQTEWVKRFLEKNSWRPLLHALVYQFSATKLSFPDEFFDAVLTDPPYYDNVPYSDLSDFFYVWFKRTLANIFPDIFATPLTPKMNEIVANKGRQQNPKHFFEKNLFLAFKEMYRILKPEGIVVIVYAHKSSEGWETMLRSLIKAKFVITASWPIQTEMKTRLRAKTSAALASSIYLVCRKLPQKEYGYFHEVQSEIKHRVHEQLERFWYDGIRGGDFFISAIGPAMEVLSQYSRLLRYSGQEISFHEQLNHIRTVSTNFLINRLLKGQENLIIDEISQFYLTFRWTFQEKTIDFGEAQKISQACGVDIHRLMGKNGIINKKGSKVSVLTALDRQSINQKDNCLVNLMHKSLIAWKERKNSQLEQIILFVNNNYDSFWQYCQAIAECLPSNSNEKQLLEGLLISKHCS